MAVIAMFDLRALFAIFGVVGLVALIVRAAIYVVVLI
jgi:hypothetical protein